MAKRYVLKIYSAGRGTSVYKALKYQEGDAQRLMYYDSFCIRFY